MFGACRTGWSAVNSNERTQKTLYATHRECVLCVRQAVAHMLLSCDVDGVYRIRGYITYRLRWNWPLAFFVVTMPRGDLDDPHWYTYALWFWGGMLFLWLARSCQSAGELWR